ncbi:MAG: hypothetical protein I8H98_07410 [Moraxellaceae bacterium]|uniref:Uncharacterized protein n=1 Tax=Acinetobacter tjernbergiae DSM 14971 = CIP 107465 TaxID=1120928 RepID=V2UYL3_9GAMM|nr:hypothetical protein [Acinetobacter tjernbergiae]ESK55112.1 hypothetical protein F990_02150 [Acinetobacter tjernbergiae DSM 14971 = CIP 107465]MBH2002078.1 hypothetical protein [Moraxellaceae bacterium]MBH2031198.1 hypothetical protein [Moraxellaceae bacterium]
MTLSAIMPILQRIILWSEIKTNQAKKFDQALRTFCYFSLILAFASILTDAYDKLFGDVE